MQAKVSPSPFPAASGFTITPSGGTPPYTATPLPSPPNPPGVIVNNGPPITVTVPPSTEPGTMIYIRVCDSSVPPDCITVTNTVA
jgi:hypothetical protein